MGSLTSTMLVNAKTLVVDGKNHIQWRSNGIGEHTLSTPQYLAVMMG